MKKPLIIPLPTHPMNLWRNDDIWNTVDWRNSDSAIARAVGMNPKSVSYQRRKRGLPKRKRGGWHPRGWRQKYKSEAPMPVVTRPQ